MTRARRLLAPDAGQESAAETIAQTCRVLLLLPMAAGTLTLLEPAARRGGWDWWLPIVIIGQEAVFTLALWGWRRAGPLALRHPLLLFTVLCGAVPVLPSVGLDSPYPFVVLGICLLAGVLHDWRGQLLFPAFAMLGWWCALGLRLRGTSDGAAAPAAAPVVTFESLLGWPVLMALATLGGAALRRLLDSQARISRRLAVVERAAAVADERARLARDMHDSVAKTLHGMGLAAQALAAWAEREPEQVGPRALELAEAAAEGARQARGLIDGLRAVSAAGAATAEGDLAAMVVELCQRWGETHDPDVSAEVPASTGLVAGAPEIVTIVEEALENVARHAHASRVTVSLQHHDDRLRLVVEDDGRGVDPAFDPRGPAEAGRYGLLGMKERAALIGGDLTIGRRDARGGTRVVLEIPARRPRPVHAGWRGVP